MKYTLLLKSNHNGSLKDKIILSFVSDLKTKPFTYTHETTSLFNGDFKRKTILLATGFESD